MVNKEYIHLVLFVCLCFFNSYYFIYLFIFLKQFLIYLFSQYLKCLVFQERKNKDMLSVMPSVFFLQYFRQITSKFPQLLGSTLTCDGPSNIWFGVSASKSVVQSLVLVKGRLFRMLSTHKMVKHTQKICRQIADELLECV